jgi:hypothetical protein
MLRTNAEIKFLKITNLLKSSYFRKQNKTKQLCTGHIPVVNSE